MKLIKKLRSGMFRISRKETEPRTAYNKWAASYDQQPDNLMLALDHELFDELLIRISLKDKNIIDVGCGTGRHWHQLFSASPGDLIGYDVSEEMLKALNRKFPRAKTFLITEDNKLDSSTGSFDVLISTLAVAHIQDIEATIKEWSRVLKPGADLLLTDYHPETLVKGGDRTFSYNGKTVHIKNFVHPLSDIIALADQSGIQLVELIERRIDEKVKHFYEKHQALHVYDKFEGTPIIYGMHLKKMNDTE